MKIFIIGTGVMGSAIAKVLAKAGQKVFVYDQTYVKVKALAKHTNIVAVKDLNQLKKADFIILSVKPFQIADVAKDIKADLKPSAVIISIAAGVKIFKIQKLFSHKAAVRVMPNLGLLVGQGIAGWKANGVNGKQKVVVKKLLNLVSENFEVKQESEIDKVTAISGSGPAYFFYLADSLQKAAKNLGFDNKTSRLLVEKTFSAAAALQSGIEYPDLISRVASKKGTTEAALKIFKKYGLDKIIVKGAQAAHKRAEEISNE
jgi:pyrroline-5-carboxylate reductase